MDPILIVVLIGAVGGALKSVLGYVPNSEGFSWLRFAKTVLLAGIAGSAVVYFTKIQGVAEPVLTIGAYIEAFFISIGVAGVANSAMKAGTGKKLT